MSDLAAYYARRASEYEAIYHRPDPVRQAELSAIGEAIGLALADRAVLEVACGTGYWTAFAAEAATRVVAIDAALQMLDVARSKRLAGSVAFLVGDAYRIADVNGEFDAAMACFWLSHVPRARLAAFLGGLASRLRPGSPVVLTDNVYMPGIGGDLVSPAGSVDTYKRRMLSDGTEHLVLKNYFDQSELRSQLATLGRVEMLAFGQCFWWAACRTRKS